MDLYNNTYYQIQSLRDLLPTAASFFAQKSSVIEDESYASNPVHFLIYKQSLKILLVAFLFRLLSKKRIAGFNNFTFYHNVNKLRFDVMQNSLVMCY